MVYLHEASIRNIDETISREWSPCTSTDKTYPNVCKDLDHFIYLPVSKLENKHFWAVGAENTPDLQAMQN